jgi:hypothetical protein
LAAGLQHQLNALGVWCSENFSIVNKIKTIIMIFGPATTPNLQFHLGANILAIRLKKSMLTSTSHKYKEYVCDHFKAKARPARYCAHRIMGIEDSAGHLKPKQFKDLYMARVDRHPIHGCEFSPDYEDIYVKELCAIQIVFLRQVLNVHSQSMIVALFTETAIVLLRILRFLLVIGYLIYLLSLKISHLTRACLNSSIELATAGKKSWVGDVLIAARKMPFSIRSLDFSNATEKTVEAYRKLVVKCAETGCNRKSINQTSSACCTEDVNIRRINLPSKKPFI